MAVEARHLNFFPSQLLGNREMMNPIEGTAGFDNTQIGFGLGAPFSGTTAAETNALVQMYGCSVFPDSDRRKQTAAAMRSDSGVTHNVPSISRKRPRIETSTIQKTPGSFSFLGEDLSITIQQHQFDIDCLVSQHMEKVRIEIEEKRKRGAMRIVAALEVRLRAKEEEIEKMGKLNWVLGEKVKSLSVENQIWRDLAQSSEATANALRTNIEQVMAHHAAVAVGSGDEDAESCCGEDPDADAHGRRVGNGNGGMCRSCGKEEARVLLLPCRHLCLCAACGSTLHTCPVCKTAKNASVHVNMS